MESPELFSRCLAKATRVVKQVRPEHLSNATPDSDQNVRELLQHLMETLQVLPQALEEDTDRTEAYEDEIDIDDEMDVNIQWQIAADAAEAAAEEIDPEETIQTPSGVRQAEDYVRTVAGDLLIHAWDLGKAIGVPVSFEGELAEEVYEDSLARFKKNEQTNFSANATSAAVSLQSRLLALFDRQIDWRAPSR